MKWLIIILSAYLFYRLIIYPYLKQKIEDAEKAKAITMKEFEKSLKRGIERTIKENNLLKSKNIPTDEDIEKYYKMYLKKLELDDQWTTDPPMPFEEFEKRAKTTAKEKDHWYVGYQFLIRITSDIFMGDGGVARMIDYEALVEEDEKKKLTSECQ